MSGSGSESARPGGPVVLHIKRRGGGATDKMVRIN